MFGTAIFILGYHDGCILHSFTATVYSLLHFRGGSGVIQTSFGLDESLPFLYDFKGQTVKLLESADVAAIIPVGSYQPHSRSGDARRFDDNEDVQTHD